MCPQMACSRRCIVTLVAFVCLFTTVHFQMSFQSPCIAGFKFTLVALIVLIIFCCILSSIDIVSNQIKVFIHDFIWSKWGLKWSKLWPVLCTFALVLVFYHEKYDSVLEKSKSLLSPFIICCVFYIRKENVQYNNSWDPWAPCVNSKKSVTQKKISFKKIIIVTDKPDPSLSIKEMPMLKFLCPSLIFVLIQTSLTLSRRRPWAKWKFFNHQLHGCKCMLVRLALTRVTTLSTH